MLKYILNQIVSFVIKLNITLSKNDIAYVEHNVEIPEVFEVLMSRNPNARTMPQIFADNELIGGYTDLIEWVEK